MKQIKKDHEGKFEQIIEDIELSVKDYTSNQTASYPKTLQKFNDVLEWGHSQDELLKMISEVNYWINKLKGITHENLKVFSIMIERSRGSIVPLNKIQHVTKLNESSFALHYEILSRYGFISMAYKEEEYNYSYVCDLYEWKSGRSGKIYTLLQNVFRIR